MTFCTPSPSSPSSMFCGGGNDVNLDSSDDSQSNKRKFFTLYQSNAQRNGGSKSSIFLKSGTTTSSAREGRSMPEAPSEDDKKLAKELNDLSLEERNKVMEEVHGVATILEEDPVLIDSKLKEMETELSWINKKQKAAFDRAMFLSPTRVRDRSFRLAFLRAEQFDASKAARRLVKYFEYKLDLFGPKRLVEPITLDDLDPDDMDALLTGSFQVESNWKDQSGRTVAFLSSANYNYKKPINQVKMNWYLIMAAVEDEDVQKYGLVHVLYDIGLNKHDVIYADLLTSIHIIRDGLPFRLPALHYCFDKSMMRGAMSLLQTMISRDQRLRFRAHFGSPLECEYALVTFGIPKPLSPYDDNGNWTRHKLLAYLETRRTLEAARRNTSHVEAYYAGSLPLVVSSSVSTSAAPVRESGGCDSDNNNDGNNSSDNSANHQTSSGTLIEAPGPNDVLLGRGRPYQEYEGNLLLGTLIDQYRDEYQDSDRFGKTCISKMVVQIMKTQKGARFLQRTGDDSYLWVEVSDAVAREKISHSFRTKNKRISASDSAISNIHHIYSNNNNNNHVHHSHNSTTTAATATQYDTVSSPANPDLTSFWNWQQHPAPTQLVHSLQSDGHVSSVTAYQAHLHGQQEQQQEHSQPESHHQPFLDPSLFQPHNVRH